MTGYAQTVLYDSVGGLQNPTERAMPPTGGKIAGDRRGVATMLFERKKGSRRKGAKLFEKGNRAAAKGKWEPERVRKFQRDLAGLRVLLGYSHVQMGEVLKPKFSGAYIKLLEGGYQSEPLRQPSEKFVKAFRDFKRSAGRSKRFKMPRATAEHFDKILSHILGKRFKCPGCAERVKAGKLAPGLEYWWARVPGQKHCPRHSHAAAKRRARQLKAKAQTRARRKAGRR